MLLAFKILHSKSLGIRSPMRAKVSEEATMKFPVESTEIIKRALLSEPHTRLGGMAHVGRTSKKFLPFVFSAIF